MMRMARRCLPADCITFLKASAMSVPISPTMPLPRTRLLKLEEDRILAPRLGHEPVGDAFGHRRFAGPDIAVENHQRILLGDQIANRELAAMVLACSSSPSWPTFSNRRSWS